MSHLDSDSIRLWCAFYDEIDDEALLRQYEPLLSADERQRRSRFVYVRDQHRFLVSRALLRTVLSQYEGDIAPADWIFVPDAHGRPEIVNDHPAAARVRFSLSHTRSLVVLALTHSRELGVDTENVRQAAPLEVAGRFLTAAELAALHVLPTDARQRRFFEYWTLKESHVKARGMGLSIPLHSFSFEFTGSDGVVMRIATGEASATNWHLWQFSVRGDYLIALCAERGRSNLPRLVIKGTVPLRAEYDLIATELRMSSAVNF